MSKLLIPRIHHLDMRKDEYKPREQRIGEWYKNRHGHWCVVTFYGNDKYIVVLVPTQEVCEKFTRENLLSKISTIGYVEIGCRSIFRKNKINLSYKKIKKMGFWWVFNSYYDPSNRFWREPNPITLPMYFTYLIEEKLPYFLMRCFPGLAVAFHVPQNSPLPIPC